MAKLACCGNAYRTSRQDRITVLEAENATYKASIHRAQDRIAVLERETQFYKRALDDSNLQIKTVSCHLSHSADKHS